MKLKEFLEAAQAAGSGYTRYYEGTIESVEKTIGLDCASEI